MNQFFSTGKALDTLHRYFRILGKTGYSSHDRLSRLMTYCFFLEMLEYCYPFFTEEDYQVLEKCQRALSAGDACMLPYYVYCTNIATLGRPIYTSDYRVRVSQLRGITRITESGIIRTA